MHDKMIGSEVDIPDVGSNRVVLMCPRLRRIDGTTVDLEPRAQLTQSLFKDRYDSAIMRGSNVDEYVPATAKTQWFDNYNNDCDLC